MVTVALCAVVKKVSHYQNFLKKAVKEELWCTWKFGDLLVVASLSSCYKLSNM